MIPLPFEGIKTGAAMSGGIAYVFDENGDFASRCNQSMCELERVLPAAEQQEKIDEAIWHLGETDEFILRNLVESHFRYTGSLRARLILDQWATLRVKFVKVFPHEYRRALKELAATQEEPAQRMAA